MAVLVKKHEPRCKMCSAPDRAKFDNLLEKRSNGEADIDGRRINMDYVAAVFFADTGRKLTKENATRHWERHCERVTEEEFILKTEARASEDSNKAAVFERVLGEGWRDRKKTPDEYLEVLRELSFLELHAKALDGQNLGISVDHALKGVDSTTRRKQEETQATLVKQLVLGIGAAVIERAAEPKQLNPADDDIIEGEIVEEADVAERPKSD